MLNEFKRSFCLIGLTIAVCVVAYTVLILATASVVAPEKRLGSLLHGSDGRVIGSRLVAQAFTRPEYLWPRPSAVDYNASGAGGSNLSTTNPKIRERADAILANYNLKDGATLPADLVTASGSGLDPHISLAAALSQADRIAMSRQVAVSTIRELLQEQAESVSVSSAASEGLINVLEFNLLMDSQFKSVESL
jgi:K+-transporting ATPase ATPase C chain